MKRLRKKTDTLESMKKPVILAIILAPLTVPTLFLAAMLFLSGYIDQGPGYAQKLLPVTVSIAILSYIWSFVGGIPIILLLYMTARLTVCRCVVLAALVGFAGGCLFSITYPGRGDSAPPSVTAAIGLVVAIASASVAIAFGLISGMPGCRVANDRRVN